MNLNKLYEEISDKSLDSYLSLSYSEKLEKAIEEQLDDDFTGVIEVPILDNPNRIFHAKLSHAEIEKIEFLEDGETGHFGGDEDYKARMEFYNLRDDLGYFIGENIAKRFGLEEPLKELARNGWNLKYNNRGYENGIEDVKIYHEKFPNVPIWLERHVFTPRDARK